MGLRCHCGGRLERVVDSRSIGSVIRRRRVCASCGQKTSTVEVVLKEKPLAVWNPRSPRVEALGDYVVTLRAAAIGTINRAFDNLERMRY